MRRKLKYVFTIYSIFLLFLELFDFKNFFEQSDRAKNGQSWPHPYSSKFPQEPIGVNDIWNSLVHQKEMSRFFLC